MSTIDEGKLKDIKVVSERALRWFSGPVTRYIQEESAIINAVVMTTPFNFAVLGWANASRDLICSRLQAGLRTVSQGDRKVFANVAAFEFEYKGRTESGLIIPS